MRGVVYRILAPRRPDFRAVELIHNRCTASAAHQFVGARVAQAGGGSLIDHKVFGRVEARDVVLRFQFSFGDHCLHLPDGFAPARTFRNLLGDQLCFHEGIGRAVHIHVQTEIDEVVVVDRYSVVTHISTVQRGINIGYVVRCGWSYSFDCDHARHGDCNADESVCLELEIHSIVIVAYSGCLACNQSDFRADFSGTLRPTTPPPPSGLCNMMA